MVKAIDITDLLLIEGTNTLINIPRLQANQGEILGVVGHSGAGKTNLLALLGMLKTPTQGKMIFFGETITPTTPNLLALKREIAFVFKEPIFKNDTIYNNIALGLKLRKISNNLIDQKIDYWLKKFKINHLATRRPEQLSPLDACRVNLAQAFVLDPKLLLLDEPLATLDSSTRDNLMEDLVEILQEMPMTIIYTTNDYQELSLLSPKVALLYKGSIIQTGDFEEVAAEPQSAAAATIVGIDNIIPGYLGNVSEAEVEFTPLGTDIRLYGLPRNSGTQEAYALLRSEDVELETFPGPQWNAVKGIITKIHPQGAQVKLHLNCGFPLIASVPQRLFSPRKYLPGTEITAVFDPAHTNIVRRLPNQGD